VAGIFGFKLFSNGKRCELGPLPMDHGSSQFTMDPGHGHGRELTGAPAPDRFRPRGPDGSWGKGRGRYRGFDFAYYRGLGGSAPAAVFQLRRVTTWVQ
jgi:hypothetical protein